MKLVQQYNKVQTQTRHYYIKLTKNVSVQHFILIGFYHLFLFLFFFVVGWALN